LNADGSVVWAKNAGTNYDLPVFDGQTRIATLSDGSSLISGFYGGTTTFGSTTLTAKGSYDAFLAKLDPNGNFLWAISAGGVNSTGSNDYANSVAVLPDGSCIVVGSFEGTATFGTTTLTAAGGSGADLFVAKINSNGTYAWVRNYGRSLSDSVNESCYDVAIAGSDGSSYITGIFFQSIPLGGSILTATSTSSWVAKLDSSGNVQWSSKLADFATPSTISAAVDGGALIIGSFSGTRSFGAYQLAASADDIFVCKISASGITEWASKAGGAVSDKGIAAEATNDGGFLVTGFFTGTASFGSFSLISAGGRDIFVAKLSATGVFEWAIRAGGLGNDSGTGLSDNGDGTYLLTGEFEGNANFGNLALTSKGGRDNFTTRLNLDGTWGNLTVPNLSTNSGQAVFSITGASTPNTPVVGNLLTATNTTLDPDGNGVFTYSWQTSTDGNTWTPVGTNSSYTVAPADEGKQLRLVVSYTDLQGFPESVTTTAGSVPNIAPTVSSFSPADGSTAIAVASNINLTFSELIQRGTGAIELRSGSATGALIESFDAATSNRLSIVGSTLTIDPTNNLSSSTQVFLVIPSGAIRDSVGNPYAGTSTYDFTTAAPLDTTPPTITGITVTSNQILIQFSEALDQTNLPAAARFTVRVAGAVQTVSGVAAVPGNATQLRLTIAVTPTSAQTLTVAYTDPTAANDITGVAQDASGNDMATTATPINADTFSTALTATTLAATYTNLILSATAAINGTGNTNNNTITGNSAVNQITGGAGNDTMDGGASGDIYIIATSADHGVAEIQDTGTNGTDELRFSSTTANQILTVFAGDTGLEQVTIGTGTTATATTSGTTALSINATLAPNGLTIIGNNGANTLTGTAFADTLIGNGGSDILNGLSGDDLLNGGAGNDTMNGGDGSDIYLIATSTDHAVAEIADNGISGTDELRFSSTTANQTLTVFAGDTGLERVVIGNGTAASASTSGTTALSINAAAAVNALTITGNDGANTLTGSALADTIIGNGGNDTLNGGLGNDNLTGGTGADIFRFASVLNTSTNVDRITDFTPTAVATTDRIQLENTGAGLFTAITATGTLAATAFVNGAAFTTATQRIRYDSGSGNLFYDADGSGNGSASILFATLNIGLDINNTQFVVT
jgi:Ca2+-binding RTX toxin-like protein